MIYAVNDNWILVPGADYLYACDGAWWDRWIDEVNAGFAGEKYTQDEAAAIRHNLTYIQSESFQGLCTEPGRIHTGNNSGFQAINLAYHHGAKLILLLGYDMQYTNGQAHWFGDHPEGFKNPQPHRWIPEFNRLARDCERAGIKVVNCSRATALECFEKVDLESWLVAVHRQDEHAKYETAYQRPKYAMGPARGNDARQDLEALPVRGSYLDVGCGRGEMVTFAGSVGFAMARGCEVVPALIDGETVVYGEVHDLPFDDNAFDAVSMFDVIEHLIPGDDELACKELQRVAKHHILLTANNRPSLNQAGDNLHINIRSYDEWHNLFCKWFDAGTVTRLAGHVYVSEGWRIDF